MDEMFNNNPLHVEVAKKLHHALQSHRYASDVMDAMEWYFMKYRSEFSFSNLKE